MNNVHICDLNNEPKRMYLINFFVILADTNDYYPVNYYNYYKSILCTYLSSNYGEIYELILCRMI
jgi:hypothetical protein